jgi:hypothetical protein
VARKELATLVGRTRDRRLPPILLDINRSLKSSKSRIEIAMTAVAAAIGSVIGYVGAEVAEEELFERLLWPQRFYNYLDLRTSLKYSFLMPMGGPLHRAALQVLDTFRDNGLYRGRAMGHMLGTAFFADNDGIQYFHHTDIDTSTGGRESPKDVRNCFWVEVLRRVDPRLVAKDPSICTASSSEEEQSHQSMKRTTHYLFRLSLEVLPEVPESRVPIVREDRITLTTITGICLSEVSGVGCGIVIGVWQRYYAFTGLLCLPLALKLLSLLVSVRREPLILPVTTEKRPGAAVFKSVTPPANTGLKHMERFEVACPNIGYFILETSHPETVLQFTRHYGHPIRISKLDRLREIMGIIVVYEFVLNFPAGLIALAWASPNAQYLWLGYQVYAIVAMHISRLVGWGGCGRVEERVAERLERVQKAYLGGDGIGMIYASLLAEKFDSATEVKRRIREVLANN